MSLTNGGRFCAGIFGLLAMCMNVVIMSGLSLKQDHVLDYTMHHLILNSKD